MSNASVVTIGWNSFIVDDSFLPDLMLAVSRGQILNADKKHVDGEYKVVPGKPISIEAVSIPVITDRDAELSDLRERLKKLEG